MTGNSNLYHKESAVEDIRALVTSTSEHRQSICGGFASAGTVHFFPPSCFKSSFLETATNIVTPSSFSETPRAIWPDIVDAMLMKRFRS